MQKYAFLDRDGTFLSEPDAPAGADHRNTFPLTSMDQFKFMDGAVEGMKMLLQKGYLLAMATNQAFLGTEKNPKDMFDQVMDRIETELAKEGIHFDFIMVCPHGPDEGCDCRKPKIGGMKKFLETHPDIDLPHSLMFGDRDTDEEFAKNLGVRFVRVPRNGTFVLPEDI